MFSHFCASYRYFFTVSHELYSSELDECNGKFHYISSGTYAGMYTYRYHVTSDFPYFLGCYRGSVEDMPGFPKNSQGRCTTDVLQSPCVDLNCNCNDVENMSASCQASNLCGDKKRKKRSVNEHVDFVRGEREKRGITQNCDGILHSDPGSPCDWKRGNANKAACEEITEYVPIE